MKRFTQIIAIVSLFLLANAMALYFAGLRVNSTKSVMLGYYWTVDKPVGKGVYVLICPPDTPIFELAKQRGYLKAGFCPGAIERLIKKVAAAKGDTVQINHEGVQVNGQMLPFSKPLAFDLAGRPMPQLELNAYRLKENELLLIGDVSPASFDSRYFGLIDRAQVKEVVRPVFNW